MRLGPRGWIVGALVVISGLIGTGVAGAVPRSVEPNLVTTLRCTTGDPWGGAPLKTFVDVYNGVAFPSDGLPGPVVNLIASTPRLQGGTQGILEYTQETTVTWKNTSNGRTGRVVVPTRARTATWEVNIHAGSGRVAFTIHQKLGAMAFVPMVNPQTSTCRGSATA